jgi:cytochrome c biogenesis protein CcdA
MDMLLAIVLMAGTLALYFIPTIVAARRQHKNGRAIMVLNIFTGWTFIGWVAALVWAFTD